MEPLSTKSSPPRIEDKLENPKIVHCGDGKPILEPLLSQHCGFRCRFAALALAPWFLDRASASPLFILPKFWTHHTIMSILETPKVTLRFTGC